MSFLWTGRLANAGGPCPVELSLFSVTSQIVCTSAGDKNLSIKKEL